MMYRIINYLDMLLSDISLYSYVNTLPITLPRKYLLAKTEFLCQIILSPLWQIFANNGNISSVTYRHLRGAQISNLICNKIYFVTLLAVAGSCLAVSLNRSNSPSEMMLSLKYYRECGARQIFDQAFNEICGLFCLI